MGEIIPRNQPFYLYFCGWEPEDDFIMLEWMERDKRRAADVGEQLDFTGHFVEATHQVWGEEFTTWHEVNELGERIEFLRRRYNTFYYVIHHEGTK